MHIVEGQLVCPNCSHIFPIRNGIPNMVSERENASAAEPVFDRLSSLQLLAEHEIV